MVMGAGSRTRFRAKGFQTLFLLRVGQEEGRQCACVLAVLPPSILSVTIPSGRLCKARRSFPLSSAFCRPLLEGGSAVARIPDNRRDNFVWTGWRIMRRSSVEFTDLVNIGKLRWPPYASDWRYKTMTMAMHETLAMAGAKASSPSLHTQGCSLCCVPVFQVLLFRGQCQSRFVTKTHCNPKSLA